MCIRDSCQRPWGPSIGPPPSTSTGLGPAPRRAYAGARDRRHAEGTMGPAMTVGLAWLLFGGTHVGLSTRAVRARLVARLGEAGFTAVYFLVATVTFTVLV